MPWVHRKSRKMPILRSDINVTPFVDVMLVLLVIFMATTPMMTGHVPINLPMGEGSALVENESSSLTLSLDAQGTLFFQEQSLSCEELGKKLQEISPEKTIYLRADSSLTYGKVMEIMTFLARAGFPKIKLIHRL